MYFPASKSGVKGAVHNFMKIFDGIILNCSEYGDAFLAKDSNSGQLQWAKLTNSWTPKDAIDDAWASGNVIRMIKTMFI
jgi:hypothetical protein